MEDIVVFGFAAIGGISILCSVVIIGRIMIGAIGGAFGCGILGVIIGLLFLGEAAAGFAIICAAVGLFGGMLVGLQEVLKMMHEEHKYHPRYTQKGTFTIDLQYFWQVLSGHR